MLLHLVLSDSIFISTFISKVLLMRVTLLLLMASISFTCFSDEYVWKSQAEPIDYKCSPDKEVGINWDKDGDQHELTTFLSSGHDEFFLTHISNIPTRALPRPDLPIHERKALIESAFYNDLSTGSSTLENNSYFLRRQSEDPSSFGIYRSGECKYYDNNEVKNIECAKALRHLEVDLDTMRFVSSYLGTWHYSNKPSDYKGDSAVLSYGKCRKYFR
jgi:hypothetical protein